MAPAAATVQRFVAGMHETFRDYGLDPRFVEAEVEQMNVHRRANTARRSVLGVMNRFKFMADNYLRHAAAAPALVQAVSVGGRGRAGR